MLSREPSYSKRAVEKKRFRLIFSGFFAIKVAKAAWRQLLGTWSPQNGARRQGLALLPPMLLVTRSAGVPPPAAGTATLPQRIQSSCRIEGGDTNIELCDLRNPQGEALLPGGPRENLSAVLWRTTGGHSRLSQRVRLPAAGATARETAVR